MKEYIKWFRIYTDKDKKWFYKVFIFDDYEKMYKFMRKHAVICGDEWFDDYVDNYAGLCHHHATEVIYADGTKERYGDIGYILLHKDELGGGTISHECTHATIYYFGALEENKDIFKDDEADEKFAWTQGYLVDQLLYKLYTSKIFIKEE